MFIKDKLESMKKISELSLNKFPEQLFKVGEQEKVREFLTCYPAQYYAIRDKSKAGGIFKLKVATNDVLTEINDYDLFTIVSGRNTNLIKWRSLCNIVCRSNCICKRCFEKSYIQFENRHI